MGGAAARARREAGLTRDGRESRSSLVDPRPARLVSIGMLALPGSVRAIGMATACGSVLAGDDRGEAGVWDRDGTRRGAVRFRSPVASVDADPDGTRVAFVAESGEAAILRQRSCERRRLEPGDRLLLDRAGTGAFVLSARRSAVDVLDAAGRVQRSFEVPGPVAGAAALPRTGGLFTVSRHGVAGRFTPWGALAWGGDWKRYAAGVATDPEGTALAVALCAHGAALHHPSSGAQLASFDLGRSIEYVALSATQVALGSADGRVAVYARGGGLVAEGKAPSRLEDLALAPDGTLVARLADGTARLWRPVSDDAPAEPPAVPSSLVFHRRLAAARGPKAPVRVAVAADGSAAAVSGAGRRVTLFDAAGGVTAEAAYEGDLLALAVVAGHAVAVSTTEIRRIGRDADEKVRHFAAEQRRALFDGTASVLATGDEVGGVRLFDAVTGREMRNGISGLGDGLERVACCANGAAFQTRRGRILAVGDGWDRLLPEHAAARGARLAAATPGAIVLASDVRVRCLAWDGTPRWDAPTGASRSHVAALADGRVLVVRPRSLRVLAADGAATETGRPEGELAAVGGGAAPVLVWKDGRRVVAAAVDGTLSVAHTCDAEVLGVAASAGGAALAVATPGALTVLRGAPAGATCANGDLRTAMR